ncbi:hypothetical protein PISMIDRAFT_94057, partial [Pisolithus microcarpus 441]
WDREGTIITEPISYTTNPSLVEFLSQYLKVPPELHGIDTSVSCPSKDEATSARAKLGLLAVKRMLKESGGSDQEVSLWKEWVSSTQGGKSCLVGGHNSKGMSRFV